MGRFSVHRIDAHAHLLDLDRITYGWIERPTPLLTHLLPDYYSIARSYPPAAYHDDVAGAGITRMVACEFGAVDAIAEARWIQECHDNTGTPEGFIAAVDLAAADLPDRLATYGELSVVRAVRQPLYWSEDPLTRLGARPDHLTDPDWLQGFERVADSGLVWDLLVYAEQLPLALPLIARFPHVPIVLEAAGWPLDRSPEGFQKWREQLHAVSEHPNVTLKLQGLALVFGATPSAVTPWISAAVEIFGADRCMFATHLPVDGLLWTAGDLVEATELALAGADEHARADYFGGTAERVYLGGERLR
ncbi:MAG TPA: amidohydrolase family protein [Nocardioides sp.]|uniref:amidohydrolase family protein n=1 Tax=uncultured Nocardioides sp. TaxID=198441 RepID=UPI00260A96D9|nr:amidohydrolase family protein [uncultured Nocardioides sp.]HRD63111.1 amidohydrolase family protein [Nocardioides sp.]HRI95956.1 amidohydrolase family protein [Nocardioides sp.]HRK46912.1 amidohydrolase family protein [Nocardioides sp.]